MKVLSIQAGAARDVAPTGGSEWWDKEWRTGFHKQVVLQPVWLAYEGFPDDEQADRVNHGGVDKAVCVYAGEHYPQWRLQPELATMEFGAFGENLTTEGLLEAAVCIGDAFALGGAVVQVSQPRQPCWKLARRWRLKNLSAQVERTGRTGFYFRVLRHGEVRAGDSFTLLERPFPEWTIARCNEVMHHLKSDKPLARLLSECPLLSASWKDALWARAQSGE